MEFGIGQLPTRADQVIENVTLAEEVGFDYFTIADTQSLARELYVTLSAGIQQANTISMGPMVTNPVTRHPVVTASAMATLDEMAPGRTVLGIGSGDSAVYTLGKRPAYLAELEETIRLIKALWRGEPVEYEGDPVHLNWLQEAERTSDVPIIMSAEGPKTLRLAGRVADGVIIGLGISPDVIEAAVEMVNEGASEAGRDPEKVEKWFLAQTNVADDRQEAIEGIKMAIAASTHHSLQFTLDGKAVPESYKPDIKHLVKNYNSHEHDQHGQTKNRCLFEELPEEIREYLTNRYAIVGTPTDCIRKIQEISETEKVDGIKMTAHPENKQRHISRLGNEVLPHAPEK